MSFSVIDYKRLKEKISEALAALESALQSKGTDKLLVKPDNPPNLDIALSAHRDSIVGAIDSLKPSRTALVQDLSAYSLAGGGTVDIDKTGLDGYSAVVAVVRVAYSASATAGVRVLWLYSPDGTNYDSEEDAVAQGNYYDITFAAGATRQATILVPILADNVRIRIKNLDPANTATIDAWTILMR